MASTVPLSQSPSVDGDTVGFVRLDEAVFAACLQTWLVCARTHKQALAGKVDREHAIQVVFNRLWGAQTATSEVEGVCRDGVRVSASIRTTSAALNHAMLDQLSEEMQTMQLTNVAVFGTLFDELSAELAVRGAVSPLLGGGAELRPDERLALLHDGLLVINQLLDLSQDESVSKTAHEAGRRIALTLAERIDKVVLRLHSNVVDFLEQLKDTTRPAERSWEELSAALQSPSVLEADAVHWTHAYLLRRVMELGAQAEWAAPMLKPNAAQLCNNRWMSRVLASQQLHDERGYLAAASRFPTRRELVVLSADQAQAFVLLPIQKGFERFAELRYVRLAEELAKIVVLVGNAIPSLVAKCVSLLQAVPKDVMSACANALPSFTWGAVPGADRASIVADLLRIGPGMTIAQYMELAQAQRASYRVALAAQLVGLQDGMDAAAATSTRHRFPALTAATALASHCAPRSVLPSLVGEELLFYALTCVRLPSQHAHWVAALQTEASMLLEQLSSLLESAKLGSALIEICATHFPDIPPHAIGGLLSLPCLLHWSPTLGDVRWIAYLACNRKLDVPAAASTGAALVDTLIEQLLLGKENVYLDPSIRPLAARTGGQLLMSIAWLNSPFATQLAAACVLLSSAYIGMPQGFLLETLLADRPSFFGLPLSAPLLADEPALLTEADVQAGNRLLHLKPPHAVIDLEWRAVKTLVALRFVHAHLVDDAVCATTGQSTLRAPALAQFSADWMDSVSVLQKALPMLQAMPPHASTRLLARVAQVLVMAGDPSRHEAFAALVAPVCFASPALATLSERHVFAPSVAHALVLPGNPDVERRFGSSVERTARLWQDALWPLVVAGVKEAATTLNAVLHGLLAASGGAATLQHNPLANATSELACALASDGLVFLASHVAASVRPLRTDSDADWSRSALGALGDVAMTLVPDKLLALVLFDRLVAVSTADAWPAERAVTVASWCARTASSLPPGPQRKAYTTLSQSLRESHNVNGVLPPLSDSALRRALWTQHPPRFRAAQANKVSGGGDTRLSLTGSGGMNGGPRAASPAPDSSPHSGRKPPLPTKNAPTSAPSEHADDDALLRRAPVRASVVSVEAAAACARQATARFRQMDVLERQFVRLSQTLFRPVPHITTLSCGDECAGPAEVSYEVMEQHISATKEPVANREAYQELSAQFWASVEALSAWSFQLGNCASACSEIALADARALMVASVALVAERVMPRPDALIAVALASRNACAAAGTMGSSAALHCIAAFLAGASSRVAADERGDTLLEQEDVDAQPSADGFVTARLALLLALVDFNCLSARPLAWVRALRMVLAAGPSLSRAELQRLLSAFCIEVSLPRMLAAALTPPQSSAVDEDDVDDAVALGPAVLQLVGALLVHADHSIAVVAALLERHVVDALRLCVHVTESWATQTACTLRFDSLEAPHSPTAAAPSWSAAWLSPLAARVIDEATATAVLRELRRALLLRRRPQGLAVATRKSLSMLRSGAWAEMDACLRLCVAPESLLETAALVAQCAPTSEASFASWVGWLAAASASGSVSPATAAALLDNFPLWRAVSWHSLSRRTICALLREFQAVEADSLRHKLLLQGVSCLAQFAGPDSVESATSVAPDAIVPCALLCVAKCVWDGAGGVDVAPVLKAYKWTTVVAPSSDADADLDARLPRAVLADLLLKKAGLASSDWATGRLMRVLETLRDCAILAPCRYAAAFLLDECAELCRASPAATLALVIRIATPLVRHVGGDAQWGASASKCFVGMCVAPLAGASAEENDKLRAVLSTFLASITDASHCLLMVSVVAQHVANPIHATPLLEAILHAYLTCVPFHPTANSTLEVAAQSWVPPSLPADSRSEFALHDLAACQKTCSSLAMAMVLERHRLISPSSEQPTSSVWAKKFAAPSLVIVQGFCPPEHRPFDWLALWVWCLQSCIAPYRAALHQECAVAVMDWVSSLDDIFENRVRLPALMSDRMVLAAGAVALMAVMCISGDDVKHSGVAHRLRVLQDKAKLVRGAESFAKLLTTLSPSKRPVLRDYCVLLIQSLFPMAPYLMGTVRSK